MAADILDAPALWGFLYTLAMCALVLLVMSQTYLLVWNRVLCKNAAICRFLGLEDPSAQRQWTHPSSQARVPPLIERMKRD